jgi:hypothetical protein
MSADGVATDGWPPGEDRPSGHVAALYVAARAGAPVEAVDVVEVIAGVGITGDRYATRLGHWSDPRWPDQQLTLVEAEVADELGVAPALLRRNVVTRGVRLADLIGARFRIGGAELRGVRTCDPCGYLEQLLSRPGLARELGRVGGGLRADVLSTGLIGLGDSVVGDAATPSTPTVRWQGRRGPQGRRR